MTPSFISRSRRRRNFPQSRFGQLRVAPFALLLFVAPVCEWSALGQSAAQRRQAADLSAVDVQALHVALDAYDSGNSTAAEPMLRRLVTAHPSNYPATEALGSLLVEQGRLPEALLLLEHAAVLAPRDPLAHANLGAALTALGRTHDAVPELQRAAALTSTPAAARALAERNLGNALLLDNQPAKAAQALAQSAEFQQSPDLVYNWALALLRAGDLAKSAQVLERIPESGRTDESYALAADLDERLGRFQDALVALQTAAQKNPSDSNLYALTVELLRHWTWDGALQIARIGEAHFPASTHFQIAEGIARYASGDYKGAVPVFAGLLQQQPENAGVADLLGRSCSLLAEDEERGCQGVYTYAMAHPGNAVMMTYAAASILHQPKDQQNLEQAEHLLTAALATEPNYAAAWFQLGVLHGAELQWRQSAADFEHAIAQDPTLPEAHYRLSRAYAHLGERDLAAAQLALQQQYASKAKTSLDARMEAVVTFLLAPSASGTGGSAVGMAGVAVAQPVQP